MLCGVSKLVQLPGRTASRLACARSPAHAAAICVLPLQAVKAGCQAGKLIGQVAKVCGGGGGGKPHLAQAGGKDASKLAEALQLARSSLMEAL